MMLKGTMINQESIKVNLDRPITVTDVLYMACVDVCERRHAMISRYPVGTDKGIFFNKIRVQSTIDHIQIRFNGKDYQFYPKIDLKTPHERIGISFVDTCVFSNSMLSGLGGDYDGDMVSCRGIWTDEANAEAEKIMNSKISALTINSDNIRTVSKEIFNAFYELTKRDDKTAKSVSPIDIEKYINMKPDDFTRSIIFSMFADSTDASTGRSVKRRPAKHNSWDTMKIPEKVYNESQVAITTTIGRFLFNHYVLYGAGLIQETGYIDMELGKKGLSKVDAMIGELYLSDKITRDQFNKYIDRRDNLGYWLNGVLAHTITLKMSKPLPSVEKRKAELLKKYEKEIAAGDIDVMKLIENDLINYAKEQLDDDESMNMYKSGDLSFENNYKNNSIIKGPVLNKITNQYDLIETSFMDGLQVKDIPAHSNSIINSNFPGAIMIRQSGYMGKKLMALLQMSMVDEPGSDCGSRNLIPITITNTNKKSVTYSYFREGNALRLMEPSMVDGYVGKTLLFRSPMSCTTKKFCNKCIGELPYRLGIENVGMYSVALSFDQMNASLKAKHDAGVKTLALDPDKIIDDI
jgi:hypothetical protein